MKKLNNYCFKCLSTELLLLGASNIFCSNCHLVFEDRDTLEYIEFHADNPINKKYYSMGSWNFYMMLRVFYGWLVRINKVFNINQFYIESEYAEYDDDFVDKNIVKTSACGIYSFDEVINGLFINTRNGSNEEKYDFIDVSRNKNNDNYRTIKMTVYCKLKNSNVRYNLADFTIIKENYENHNLYFEDWNLLTVSNSSLEGSYRDLRVAYNKHS